MMRRLMFQHACLRSAVETPAPSSPCCPYFFSLFMHGLSKIVSNPLPTVRHLTTRDLN